MKIEAAARLHASSSVTAAKFDPTDVLTFDAFVKAAKSLHLDIGQSNGFDFDVAVNPEGEKETVKRLRGVYLVRSNNFSQYSKSSFAKKLKGFAALSDKEAFIEIMVVPKSTIVLMVAWSDLSDSTPKANPKKSSPKKEFQAGATAAEKDWKNSDSLIMPRQSPSSMQRQIDFLRKNFIDVSDEFIRGYVTETYRLANLPAPK